MMILASCSITGNQLSVFNAPLQSSRVAYVRLGLLQPEQCYYRCAKRGRRVAKKEQDKRFNCAQFMSFLISIQLHFENNHPS